ncbi:MAG: hypothetical protein CMM99_05100 [Rickettsiales bacterium]|nr:hypothetical protein [Rickettsiales bacterium]
MEVLICVISGFFWALFDLTRKLSLKFFSPKSILICLMLMQSILFLVWTFYTDFSLDLKNYLIPSCLLIIIGVISALLFLKAISNSELSLTIPLLSFTPLFSAVLSYFLLNEKLTAIQYFAISFIIIGALILYSSSFKISSIFQSIITIKENLSAKIMIIVAFSWSITPILDKISLKYSSINIHGLFQSLGMLLILIFFSIPEIKKLKQFKINKINLILLTIFIGITATILQFYAILNNYVPIMEAIKRTIGQFGSLFFGYFVFKEKITSQKIVGLIFLSVGILNII